VVGQCGGFAAGNGAQYGFIGSVQIGKNGIGIGETAGIQAG